MGRKCEWSKERVAEYILEEYRKNGDKLRCTNVPSRVRQLVVEYWGGWRKALMALGIETIYKELAYEELKVSEGADKISKPDKGNVEALCWRCFRPISSKENFCPWHDHFELPKGVKFFTKDITYSGRRAEVAIIVECPLFIKETDELRKASRREMLERIGEGYLQSSHGRGCYKVRL